MLSELDDVSRTAPDPKTQLSKYSRFYADINRKWLRETKMGTFADDTAIFATHADSTTASRNLQEHLLTIQN